MTDTNHIDRILSPWLYENGATPAPHPSAPAAPHETRLQSAGSSGGGTVSLTPETLYASARSLDRIRGEDACSQGIDSLTYRGPLTTWAPEPGTIWNNRLLVTKTSALCGNEAVVWAAWADRLDAERRADIVEHKHRVDEEIRQNGCVVNAQADVTVPAPSG